jgi:hypothetical protein
MPAYAVKHMARGSHLHGIISGPLPTALLIGKEMRQQHIRLVLKNGGSWITLSCGRPSSRAMDGLFRSFLPIPMLA